MDNPPITFALTLIQYPVLSFVINPKIKYNIESYLHDKEITFGFNFSGNININNSRKISCNLKIQSEILIKENNYSVARAKIEVLGKYIGKPFFNEEYIKRFEANFYAILFPFLRETHSNLLLKNFFNIQLPIINVANTVVKEREKFIINGIEKLQK